MLHFLERQSVFSLHSCPRIVLFATARRRYRSERQILMAFSSQSFYQVNNPLPGEIVDDIQHCPSTTKRGMRRAKAHSARLDPAPHNQALRPSVSPISTRHWSSGVGDSPPEFCSRCAGAAFCDRNKKIRRLVSIQFKADNDVFTRIGGSLG